jgi:hypothetical protein
VGELYFEVTIGYSPTGRRRRGGLDPLAGRRAADRRGVVQLPLLRVVVGAPDLAAGESVIKSHLH